MDKELSGHRNIAKYLGNIQPGVPILCSGFVEYAKSAEDILSQERVIQ